MPWFKSKVLAACAWAAPALATVIPHPDAQVARAHGLAVQLDLQQNYAQATFSVPCTACLGHHHTDQHDESLILNFTSHAQDHACGSSNITLNGLHLAQEWNGDFASGSGSYQAVADVAQNDWFLQHHLDLEWKTACLRGNQETDAAQVLTVNIKAIDGKPIQTPSGFTISFRQHTSPPTLLRLEAVPNPSAGNKDVADSWREPPQPLRLVLSKASQTPPEEVKGPSLEDDIRELRALESQVQALQSLIAEKNGLIHSRLRKQVQHVSQQLGECEGIFCIFKTIAHKARGAWKMACIRLKPNHSPEKTGRPEHAFAQAHGHAAQVAHMADDDPRASPSTPPPYTAAAVELPPRPTTESPYVLALEITLGVLCCASIFAAIRHKCSSLRTRTDRAAAREERLNARAYRRAARQHAFGKWWRKCWRGNWAQRDSERIADYEEKRGLISEQEEILEGAMQEEIRQLRAAHDVVHDLVRDAEEGRASYHYQSGHPRRPYSPMSTASTYPPTSLPEMPSRPLSRTESLPSYRSGTPTEPPSYESDGDMSEGVANGFRQYALTSTRSEVSSHWTPDSSVVDVSPRPSAETLRYPVSILTLDEEDSDAD